jgi:hypothetical protein
MITPIIFTNLADRKQLLAVHGYHDEYNAGAEIRVEFTQADAAI